MQLLRLLYSWIAVVAAVQFGAAGTGTEPSVAKETCWEFRADYEVPPTTGWFASFPGLTFEGLLSYHRLIYGLEGTNLYLLYQSHPPQGSGATTNLVQLTESVSKADVIVDRLPGGQAYQFVIRVNPHLHPTVAAQAFHAALQKSFTLPEVSNDPALDEATWRGRYTTTLAVANETLGYVEVALLTGVSIVSEGADWAITMSAIADGDYAAAVALLPVVSYSMVAGSKALLRVGSCGGIGPSRAAGGPCKVLGTYFPEQCKALIRARKRTTVAEQFAELKNGGVTYSQLDNIQKQRRILQPPGSHGGLKSGFSPICPEPSSSAKGAPWVCHHRLPWALAAEFALIGIDVNDPSWGIWVSGAKGAKHPQFSYREGYYDEWKTFLDSQRSAGQFPTALEVQGHLSTLEKGFYSGEQPEGGGRCGL